MPRRLLALAAVSLLVSALLASCARRMVTASGGSVEGRSRAGLVSASDRTLRVGLGLATSASRISATGEWRIWGAGGEGVLVRAARGDTWRVERQGTRVRAIRSDGSATAWQERGLIARPLDDTEGLVSYGGRRYRGELLFLPGDTGIVAVNRLRMDDYLRGVVPLEIGTKAAGDSSAVQAQAVAARSYAYTHVGQGSASRPYDVTAGVSDQIYGGVEVETAVGDDAVRATRGLVLTFDRRVVNAPYHSTCGGTTAEAGEVWRTAGEPYLQRVSDRIPGTDRFYCDIAPRFRWTRTLDGETLRAALVQYLGTYTNVPGSYPGNPRDVMVDTRTPSGRVGTLKVATDRGNYVLRGNDVRFVLRPPGGEILNSTYFSVETTVGRDGTISRLTIRGTGYGHGVGMCQWGAIGRARSGQDFRTILRTYYPGTEVGPVE